jgi:CheY-like chemotaxis protein
VARILVVDDDPDIRSSLLGALAEQGYTVEVAPDGREALLRLSAGPSPDAILLDLMMPVMNGWQFRARQLALPAFAAIPTIVMTAIANLERAAISADLFLPKPIRLSQLCEALHRCVAGSDEAWPELPPAPMVVEASWQLVTPYRGESCRWEDGTGRWVTVSLGEEEELGMAVVQSWHSQRASFDRYEDALVYSAALRA